MQTKWVFEIGQIECNEWVFLMREQDVKKNGKKWKTNES